MDTISEVLVLARWVHFASMFALFGGACFWLSIGPNRRTDVPPDGLPWAVCGTTRLLRVAGPIAAVSGIAWLIAMIANMTGDVAGIIDPETLHAFFFETPFGPLALTRLVLLGAVVGVPVLPIKASLCFVATALIAALLLVSQVWLGHAAEGGASLNGALMVVAYVAHVLAAAAWVGGLLPLFLALLEQRRRGDPQAAILRLLSRYSVMALVAVGVILASGLVNTAFRLGSAPALLVTTVYGRILATKVALVAIMLLLAAFHRVVVMPRLAVSPGSPRSLRHLSGSIALEGAIGILVLGTAAVLGITPPPH